jgi:hypothetical protein
MAALSAWQHAPTAHSGRTTQAWDAEVTDVPRGLPLRGVRESQCENDRVVSVYAIDSISTPNIMSKKAGKRYAILKNSWQASGVNTVCHYFTTGVEITTVVIWTWGQDIILTKQIHFCIELK